jgi:hypothetical protein
MQAARARESYVKSILPDQDSPAAGEPSRVNRDLELIKNSGTGYPTGTCTLVHVRVIVIARTCNSV